MKLTNRRSLLKLLGAAVVSAVLGIPMPKKERLYFDPEWFKGWDSSGLQKDFTFILSGVYDNGYFKTYEKIYLGPVPGDIVTLDMFPGTVFVMTPENTLKVVDKGLKP